MNVLDPAILEILADPLDHQRLAWDPQSDSLHNHASGRVYSVRNGIPVFAAPESASAVEVPAARYDGISAWYDAAMQGNGARGELALSSAEFLSSLLGAGSGLVVDIGCGTGLSAATLRGLGYQPFGIDLSQDMLSHACERMPVAQADVSRLPLKNDCVTLAISTFTTTDWDDLAGALAEIQRCLAPGGRYISLGVHPCFYGSYAEDINGLHVRQHPGYGTSHFRPPRLHTSAVRSRVGAWHRPLSALINSFTESGFRITRIEEGGSRALPELLAICVEKPATVRKNCST